MNSYEIMKNNFMLTLTDRCKELTSETLMVILKSLDIAAESFEITERETSLSVVEGDLPEVAKIYLACKKIEGLSELTLKFRFYRLRTFFKYVPKPLNTITRTDIRVFLYTLQSDTAVSNRTLEHIRTIICGFFRWAASEGYIPADPTVNIKPIKYEQKQRCSLTQLELEYMRRACKSIRETAMIEFLYSTGCRVSEMINVKITDVNFQTSEVHLFGKGNKHRTSYLNAKSAVALKDYLNTRTDNCPYLFITCRKPYRKLCKEQVEKIVSQISQRANLPKHVTPHIFRHTTATQAVKNGMSVQEVQKLLGHANISTTMVYVDSDQNAVKNSHVRAVI